MDANDLKDEKEKKMKAYQKAIGDICFVIFIYKEHFCGVRKEIR